MSDINFLRDFSAQPAKPVEDQLTKLSGSFSDSNVSGRSTTQMPAPSKELPKRLVSNGTTQRFTNTNVEAAPVQPKAEVSVEPPQPVVTPKQDTVNQVTANQVTQKFSYGVVGDVPPGFKAAVACANCKYQGFDRCTKYNFPLSFNYSCDSFEVIKVETEEEDSSQVEMYTKEPPREEQLTPLDKAVLDYDAVLTTFADGDIASAALNKVIERFTNRSEYADAFLKLRYRRFYEDKHGNLEGAYLEIKESN